MLCLMKTFAGFGGFIILLIGLAMLGVTVFAFTRAELVFYQYTYLIILLVADLVIIFSAVLGIIGVKRQSGVLILIFQIMVMLFFAVFLALGICAIVLPKDVFNQECSKNTKQFVQASNEAYLKATTKFCITEACGLKNQSIDSKWDNIIERTALKQLNRQDTASVNYASSPSGKDDSTNGTIKAAFQVIGALQSSLKCSGWCEPRLFYYFSDVNNGKPESACYNTMKQNLENFGHYIAIAAFAAAGFLLLVCVCGLGVCCSKKEQPFASRFIVSNNGNYQRANY